MVRYSNSQASPYSVRNKHCSNGPRATQKCKQQQQKKIPLQLPFKIIMIFTPGSVFIANPFSRNKPHNYKHRMHPLLEQQVVLVSVAKYQNFWSSILCAVTS